MSVQMSTSLLGGIVLGLLALLISLQLIGVLDVMNVAEWAIESFTFLLEELFNIRTEEDRIAIESTSALTCATDTVARINQLIEDGEVIPENIFDSPSCSQGMPVGLAIARNAPRHGLMTARVIAVTDKITGAGIADIENPDAAYECGSDDNVKECGKIDNEICKKGERCVEGIGLAGITVWDCKKDDTCIPPAERVSKEFFPDASSLCFGNDMHVCVLCGTQADLTPDKVCCKCNFGGAISYSYGLKCGGCFGMTGLCEDAPNQNKCKDLGVEFVHSCAAEVYEDERSFQCEVLGFELPQKGLVEDELFKSDPLLGPINYIAVTGDPKYVVFNEKFPESVSQNWNLLGEDLAIIYIGTAAGITLLTDCAIPGVGKMLGKASEGVVNTGIAKTLKSHVDDTKNFIGGFQDGATNKISRIFLKRGLNKAKKNSLKKQAEKNIEDISRLPLAKEDIYALKWELRAASDLSETAEDLTDEAAEELAYELGELWLVKNNADLSDAVRQEADDKIIEKLGKLEIYPNTVPDDEYIMNPIIRASDGLVQIHRARSHRLPELTNFMKTGSIVVENHDVDEKVLQKLIFETTDMFPDKSKVDMAVEVIVKQASEGDAAAKGFISAAGAIADGDGKVKAATFLKLMRDNGITGKSLDPTTKKGAATIGLGLAMVGAAKIENMDYLRDPSNCGTNALCLFGHDWSLDISADMKFQGKMGDDALNLPLELKEAENGGQFYLASPCKADIILTQSKCECRKFYEADIFYSDIVIEEWGIKLVPAPGLAPVFIFTIIETFTVEAKFPTDSTYEFKYDGDPITFKFTPEEDEKNTEEITLKDGDTITDPLVLEHALRSMDKDQLNHWVRPNTNYEKQLHNPLNDDEPNEYKFSRMIRQNLEQGVNYKKCIKGDWWEFWQENENPDCIKVELKGYGDYDPNFCFEKKWDEASRAEAALFGTEMVVGAAAALLAAPTGPGALVAYCGTSMAVSTAGAWVLAGYMAEDKWPNGINQ